MVLLRSLLIGYCPLCVSLIFTLLSLFLLPLTSLFNSLITLKLQSHATGKSPLDDNNHHPCNRDDQYFEADSLTIRTLLLQSFPFFYRLSPLSLCMFCNWTTETNINSILFTPSLSSLWWKSTTKMSKICCPMVWKRWTSGPAGTRSSCLAWRRSRWSRRRISAESWMSERPIARLPPPKWTLRGEGGLEAEPEGEFWKSFHCAASCFLEKAISNQLLSLPYH